MPSEENKPSLVPVYLGLLGLVAFVAFIVWVVVSTPPQRGKKPIKRDAAPQAEPKESAPREETTKPDERQGLREPPPVFTPRTQPGLRLVLRSLATGESDVLRVRRAALAIEEGAAPSPFVAAGPFEARFEGLLTLPRRTRASFHVESTGSGRILVDGEELLSFDGEGSTEQLRLSKGARALRIEFRSPATGAARLRVLWEGRRFAREPLPGTWLSHETSEAQFAAELAHEGALCGRVGSATSATKTGARSSARRRISRTLQGGCSPSGFGAGCSSLGRCGAPRGCRSSCTVP